MSPPVPFRHSAETRALMSEKRRARAAATTPEQRAEHAARCRANWSRLTPEQRAARAARNSASNRAYWSTLTPEQRAARSQQLHRAHLTDEQRQLVIAAVQSGQKAADVAAQWHLTPGYVSWLKCAARRNARGMA